MVENNETDKKEIRIRGSEDRGQRDEGETGERDLLWSGWGVDNAEGRE